MSQLNLTIADKIASDCLAKGRELGFAPLAVAVLDPGGHAIVTKRADGAGIVRNEIAFAKAWGALGMGLPSRALADRAAKMPVFYEAVAVVSGGRLVPVPGGVLIRSGDQLVGAIGVSGDTSDNDETCAVAAIQAAGLTADIEVR